MNQVYYILVKIIFPQLKRPRQEIGSVIKKIKKMSGPKYVV